MYPTLRPTEANSRQSGDADGVLLIREREASARHIYLRASKGAAFFDGKKPNCERLLRNRAPNFPKAVVFVASRLPGEEKRILCMFMHIDTEKRGFCFLLPQKKNKKKQQNNRHEDSITL
jgi:hypothetical protein